MAPRSIAELRRMAQQRLPRLVFDYVEGGAWRQHTLRANREALAGWHLRPRQLVDVSHRRLDTRLIGQDVALPLVLSPVALGGMLWADGERHCARAAARAGVPYVHATLSIDCIENVAAATTRPPWFQLYLLRDRDLSERLMARAWRAGCRVLMVTIDMPLLADHLHSTRRGLRLPPPAVASLAWDLARHPAWLYRHLQRGKLGLGNLEGALTGINGLAGLNAWLDANLDPSLTWKDLAWVRKRWDGALVVKGILEPDDAQLAAEVGAEAVVVSNHGGRQLDGAQASIAALPGVVDAVGQRMEVHVDGGFRSGQEILVALALGARAVHIGRPYLYGLGARGRPGVEHSLAILHRELDLTLALCGRRSLEEVDETLLARRGYR